MIVSELKLYDFRKFKSNGNEPGLSITFHKGLNALIGENDSGKTAVIDAMKLVLLTQSNEYIRPTDDDFFVDSNGQSVTEFRIECLLEDFTDNEAKNFIEYLNFCKVEDKISYSMHLYYKAWKEKNRIFSELRIGDAVDGVVMDGRARELLKAVYLKPLRDAEREMSSGRNSRISQILLGHPIFLKQDSHKLIDILKDANQNVEKYFSEDDGKVILRSIKSTLDAFNESDNTSDARFETSDYQLKAILESLSLTVPEIHPGLGELNLLFMAAELLLLKHEDNGGLKLALIEELEAHLHPQAQLRLISYLQNEYNESGAQIIVSTHSTMLASKINLKNIVLLKNGVGYDLSYGKTGLEKGDYLFLQRFLDTSKANLFFAKGIIMVEGDAENILIPSLAEIIGLPLEKHGVSVVNVGSTAFLRYSRILTRADHSSVSIPVAIITDCDVRPEYKENGSFDKKLMETITKVGDKESYYSVDTIKGFIAPRWTLEYCLALSALASDFHKAIHYAKKIKNSDKYSLTVDKIQSENGIVETEQSAWKQLSNEEKAYKIFQLMLDESNKSGLKAIVAQCLASMLKWKYVEKTDDLTEENMFDLDLYQYRILEDERIKLKEIIENDPYINYLAKAIRYAVGLEV